jgi:hypothetical protein
MALFIIITVRISDLRINVHMLRVSNNNDLCELDYEKYFNYKNKMCQIVFHKKEGKVISVRGRRSP